MFLCRFFRVTVTPIDDSGRFLAKLFEFRNHT
jgi:hypothetical protein